MIRFSPGASRAMIEGQAHNEVQLLNAGSTFGKYQIVRPVGRGGMGVVYEATHTELKKKVALKVLNPQFAHEPEIAARFLREGESAARIRHPNVVDIYDVGVEGEIHYLVMEFLDGEDLGMLLKAQGKLDPEEVADLILPVTAALMAAHEVGVVHRDLKPGNIFLAHGFADEREPKVLDFGISKLLSQQPRYGITTTGALLGTPFYMSPEQAHGGKNVDARSDQYSLGVIMYQCVTGARPFTADSMYQVLHQIVQGDFQPPSTMRPDLPPAFEQLILTAMKTSPADRFPSLIDLGRELLAFANPRTRAVWSTVYAPTGSRPEPRGGTSTPPALLADVHPNNPPTPIHGPGASQLLNPPPRQLPILAGIGLLFFVALIIGGSMLWRATQTTVLLQPAVVDLDPAAPSAASVDRPRAASTERATQSERTEPSTYEVDLRVTPKYAIIELDGAVQPGRTLRRTLLKDGEPHVIRVRAKGYETVEIHFVDAPPPERVVLEARPKSKRRVARRKRRSSNRRRSNREKPVVKEGTNDAPIIR